MIIIVAGLFGLAEFLDSTLNQKRLLMIDLVVTNTGVLELTDSFLYTSFLCLLKHFYVYISCVLAHQHVHNLLSIVKSKLHVHS